MRATLVPLLFDVALIASPKSSIRSFRFFAGPRSFASLKVKAELKKLLHLQNCRQLMRVSNTYLLEMSHTFKKPLVVTTVMKLLQRPRTIGFPSVAIRKRVCFTVPCTVLKVTRSLSIAIKLSS